MHLEPLMDARVHASCDEGLDLQSFARQEMLLVSNAIVGSDAASVPVRGRERTLCQRSSRSATASSSCPTRGGDKERKGFVGARRTRP